LLEARKVCQQKVFLERAGTSTSGVGSVAAKKSEGPSVAGLPLAIATERIPQQVTPAAPKNGARRERGADDQWPDSRAGSTSY